MGTRDLGLLTSVNRGKQGGFVGPLGPKDDLGRGKYCVGSTSSGFVPCLTMRGKREGIFLLLARAFWGAVQETTYQNKKESIFCSPITTSVAWRNLREKRLGSRWTTSGWESQLETGGKTRVGNITRHRGAPLSSLVNGRGHEPGDLGGAIHIGKKSRKEDTNS